MSIFKKFIQSFSSPRLSGGKFYDFSVKCKRCGEVIQGQVNVDNEPSLEFGDKGKSFYVCRKVMMGSGSCFQQIEVVFKFDESRRVLEHQITGGEFVEK
jgi:hypothetical protein